MKINLKQTINIFFFLISIFFLMGSIINLNKFSKITTYFRGESPLPPDHGHLGVTVNGVQYSQRDDETDEQFRQRIAKIRVYENGVVVGGVLMEPKE